jgi:hypothetical protein
VGPKVAGGLCFCEQGGERLGGAGRIQPKLVPAPAQGRQRRAYPFHGRGSLPVTTAHQRLLRADGVAHYGVQQPFQVGVGLVGFSRREQILIAEPARDYPGGGRDVRAGRTQGVPANRDFLQGIEHNIGRITPDQDDGRPCAKQRRNLFGGDNLRVVLDHDVEVDIGQLMPGSRAHRAEHRYRTHSAIVLVVRGDLAYDSAVRAAAKPGPASHPVRVTRT